MTQFLIPDHGVSSPRNYPYASSVSSSAASSTCSVFSVDASSQTSNTSVSTTSSHQGWEAEDIWSSSRQRGQASAEDSGALNIAPITRVNTYPQYQPPSYQEQSSAKILPPLRTTDLPIPQEQRQHPRRSSSTTKNGSPPSLVRQCERKGTFVDRLVVSATQMVEVIWPLSVPTCRRETGRESGRGVLPLRVFIEETLRRSKTSYSTLQVALYYLILIRPHVPKHDFTMEQPGECQTLRALQCGRRMFLAALILASKYLQDRNYSARAWSKISGLRVCEINTNEMAFVQAIGWKLHIPLQTWDRWQEIVFQYSPPHPPTSPGACAIGSNYNAWRAILPVLTPELDTIDVTPRTPNRQFSFEQSLAPQSPLAPRTEPKPTSTPKDYKLPKFLEPKPDMLPPTPSLARMLPLPTPILTPHSAISVTPAVSAVGYNSRRTSMCSAMATAQGSSLARCAMEWNPAFRSANDCLTRRPSVVSSLSSSSSPESMISDASSRSSRASSISSVSSVSLAPNSQANCLARLATCRNAKLPYPAPMPKIASSSETSLESMVSESLSPDLESFHFDSSSTSSGSGDETTPTAALPIRARPAPTTTPSDPITPTRRSSKSSQYSEDPRRSRKRGRSSADMSHLHQNVRSMLSSQRPSSAQQLCESPLSLKTPNTVVPDRCLASSFLLSGLEDGERTPLAGLGYGSSSGGCGSGSGLAKALQSPGGAVPERRLPISRDAGRKRCCASEAAMPKMKMGPGMWEGVL